MHTGIHDLEDRGYFKFGYKLTKNIDMKDFENSKFMLTEQEKKELKVEQEKEQQSKKEVENPSCNIRCYKDNIECPRPPNTKKFLAEIKRLNSECCPNDLVKEDTKKVLEYCAP